MPSILRLPKEHSFSELRLSDMFSYDGSVYQVTDCANDKGYYNARRIKDNTYIYLTSDTRVISTNYKD